MSTCDLLNSAFSHGPRATHARMFARMFALFTSCGTHTDYFCMFVTKTELNPTRPDPNNPVHLVD